MAGAVLSNEVAGEGLGDISNEALKMRRLREAFVLYPASETLSDSWVVYCCLLMLFTLLAARFPSCY